MLREILVPAVLSMAGVVLGSVWLDPTRARVVRRVGGTLVLLGVAVLVIAAIVK